MKDSAHPWEQLQGNWTRVHIDYADKFLRRHFLIVVDSLSKWPEVAISKLAPTTDFTIVRLIEIYSRNGLPITVVTDNASIFALDGFQAFLSRRGIQYKPILDIRPLMD